MDAFRSANARALFEGQGRFLALQSSLAGLLA
jgi:hypothetical protein